jgi:hypothetical protein
MLALCAYLHPTHAVADCAATPWFVYEGSQLFRHSQTNAYVYVTTHMAVDADGASNAYHPSDTGLDALANAGFPNGNWQSILVVDPDDSSRPYVQTTGAHKGFFLSQTRLQDPSKPAIDPERYVDATTVPYIVFPGAFFKANGTGDFGDVGIAFNLTNASMTPFIVADLGPRNAKLGEVSVKLAEALGGSHVNPRNGAGLPAGRFAYVVFPKSHGARRWPVSAGDIAARADAELQRSGGRDGLLSCVR